MLGVERLDGIMEMLKDGQAVSIHTLSKTLYISESTLRRDLAALQKEGLIRRIRGGAILAANNRDVPRLIRENEAPDIKNIIGARAAAQGVDELVKKAIAGFTGSTGTMPPKGGNPALTDDQVKATVEWMVAQSK